LDISDPAERKKRTLSPSNMLYTNPKIKPSLMPILYALFNSSPLMPKNPNSSLFCNAADKFVSTVIIVRPIGTEIDAMSLVHLNLVSRRNITNKGFYIPLLLSNAG